MPRVQRHQCVTWLLVMTWLAWGGTVWAQNPGDTVQFTGTNTLNVGTLTQNTNPVLDSRSAGQCTGGAVVTEVRVNQAPVCSSPTGVVLSVEGQGGAVDFTTGTAGTAPLFSGSGGVVTLNIPSASGAGVTGGTISKTEYDLLPSSGQKAALVGTTGTPNGTTNRYVTETDPSRTNARSPIGAASPCAEGEGPFSVGGFFACQAGSGSGSSTPTAPSVDLVALSGASATATAAIPANSWVFGVQAQVTTAITGPTTFQVGIAGHTDRWGAAISGAEGTLSNIGDFDVTAPVYYANPTNVVVTANTTPFSTGAIRLYLYYATLNTFAFGRNVPLATLSPLSGATATASGFIPANSWVFGMRVQVSSVITGASSFQIGVPGDPDRWGKAVNIAQGSVNDIADFQTVAPQYYKTATDVVLTSNGGSFTAGGATLSLYAVTLDSFLTSFSGGSGGLATVSDTAQSQNATVNQETISVGADLQFESDDGSAKFEVSTVQTSPQQVIRVNLRVPPTGGAQSFQEIFDGTGGQIAHLTSANRLKLRGTDPNGTGFDIYESGGDMFFECRQGDGTPCDRVFEMAANRKTVIGTAARPDATRWIHAEPDTLDVECRTTDPTAPTTDRMKSYCKNDELYVRNESTVIGPLNSLTVKEADNTPTVTGVKSITVTNGTLTDNGNGAVSITTGGGGGSGDVVGDDTSTTAQNIVAYSGTGGKNVTELTGTQGDVLYHNGTNWAKLAAGTSGNVLRTNGAGANPSWSATATAATVRRSSRMAFSSIEAGNASAFVDTLAGTNRDLGAVYYVDNNATDGCAYWEFDIPSNLAATPAWKVIVKFGAVAGAGGDARLRIRGSVIADNDSIDKAATMLTDYAQYATGASPTMQIQTLPTSGDYDATLALVANQLLAIEVCRDSDSASDTVSNIVFVKSISVEFAEN